MLNYLYQRTHRAPDRHEPKSLYNQHCKENKEKRIPVSSGFHLNYKTRVYGQVDYHKK